MNEIADELESLAAAFKTLAEQFEDMSEGARVDRFQDGRSASYEDAAERLLARAEELRTQRSGPTYKPQPKPTYKPQPKPIEVRDGQWWAWESADGIVASPWRIDACSEGMAYGYVVDKGHYCALVTSLLRDPRFLYLGDGEHPAT